MLVRRRVTTNKKPRFLEQDTVYSDSASLHPCVLQMGTGKFNAGRGGGGNPQGSSSVYLPLINPAMD